MKTTSLIKAIEKAGIHVKDLSEERTDMFTKEKYISRAYIAFGPKYKVHWHDQKGSATCIQIQRLNDRNDSQRDHFPGWFAHTIKEVIADLTKN